MAVCPSLPDSGQELRLVGTHLADERLIFGMFVGGGPEHHFREYRREGYSFRGQQVD